MTWTVTGPNLLVTGTTSDGAFADFDGISGLWANAQNLARRVTYPGTVSSGATIDTDGATLSIEELDADTIDSNHILVSWVSNDGFGPAGVYPAIVEKSSPPTVGAAAGTGVSAAASEKQWCAVLSALKALVVDRSTMAYYDLNTATNTVTINGGLEDLASILTNDASDVTRLDNNNGLIVANGVPAEAIVAQTGSGSLVLGALQTLTGINFSANIGVLAPIDSTRALLAYIDGSLKVVVLSVSGETVTVGTPLTIGATSGRPEMVRIGSTNTYGLFRVSGGNLLFRTVAITGTTVADNADEVTVAASATYTLRGADYFTDGANNIYAVLTGAGNTYYVVISSGVVNARFYFAPAGQALAEKFTLPFTGVQPGGMTLDKTLGTVVIGSNAPAVEPVIYSAYPYATGTAFYESYPTGTATYSMKWI